MSGSGWVGGRFGDVMWFAVVWHVLGGHVECDAGWSASLSNGETIPSAHYSP